MHFYLKPAGLLNHHLTLAGHLLRKKNVPEQANFSLL
jgi:hypothetical protein